MGKTAGWAQNEEHNRAERGCTCQNTLHMSLVLMQHLWGPSDWPLLHYSMPTTQSFKCTGSLWAARRLLAPSCCNPEPFCECVCVCDCMRSGLKDVPFSFTKRKKEKTRGQQTWQLRRDALQAVLLLPWCWLSPVSKPINDYVCLLMRTLAPQQGQCFVLAPSGGTQSIEMRDRSYVCSSSDTEWAAASKEVTLSKRHVCAKLNRCWLSHGDCLPFLWPVTLLVLAADHFLILWNMHWQSTIIDYNGSQEKKQPLKWNLHTNFYYW